MFKRINIYDCDGILLNSLHRYRTGADNKIDLPYWIAKDTRENILMDKPSVLADHYKEALANPEIFVIIATARACEYNDTNYEVIHNKLGKPDLFIHRQGRHDRRGGAELKLEGIIPLFSRPEFEGVKIHVYEDNAIYLRDMCLALRDYGETVGHFNPSYQGH